MATPTRANLNRMSLGLKKPFAIVKVDSEISLISFHEIPIRENGSGGAVEVEDATIAQWIHLCLPY